MEARIELSLQTSFLMVVARYYAPEGGHLRLSFYLENDKKVRPELRF